MCRLIGYIGEPVVMANIVMKTQHSLLAQSMSARETHFHVNGDGCGMAWYPVAGTLTTPALYRSIRPAWNDSNLKSLANTLRSSLFMAHIRAATEGSLSQENCHPFQYKDRLMVHNGAISHFSKIKRPLLNALSDENFSWIQGQTDSEHLFALIMEYLGDDNSPEARVKAVQKAFVFIQKAYEDAGIDGLMHINTFCTDGKSLLATRYTSKGSEPASTMYYAHGDIKEKGEHFYVEESDSPSASVVLVSEKLDDYSNWIEVPQNHFLLVNEDHSVELFPIQAPFQA